MNIKGIEFSEGEVKAICQRFQVRELALFGSAASGELKGASDIDILVEFFPSAEIGFMELSKMQRELSAALNRHVDLVPKGGLKPRIRESVIASSRILYAA